MDCPTCLNSPEKVIAALVHRNGVCVLESHVCPTCGGDGEISPDQFERISAGKVVRDLRVQAHLTVHQMAVIANVSPRDVSDYEHGRLPDDDEHRGVRDKLYAALGDVKQIVASRS